MHRSALLTLPLALLLAVVLLSACSQPRESRSGPAPTGRTSSVGLSWALAGSQLAMLLLTLAVSRRLIELSAATRRSVPADASVFRRAASEKEAQLPVALERLRRSTQVRWTPHRISLALPALVAVAVGLPAGFDQAAQWAFIAGGLHLLVFGPWLAWLELFSRSVSDLRRQQSLLGLSAGGGYFIGVAIDSALVALSLVL